MELNSAVNMPSLAPSAALAHYSSCDGGAGDGAAADCDPNRVLEQLFECPSSNERNTNTLFSGSDSDAAVKTPSAGSDSPGFALHDMAVAIHSTAPAVPFSAAATVPMVGSPLYSPPPSFPPAPSHFQPSCPQVPVVCSQSQSHSQSQLHSLPFLLQPHVAAPLSSGHYGSGTPSVSQLSHLSAHPSPTAPPPYPHHHHHFSQQPPGPSLHAQTAPQQPHQLNHSRDFSMCGTGLASSYVPPFTASVPPFASVSPVSLHTAASLSPAASFTPNFSSTPAVSLPPGVSSCTAALCTPLSGSVSPAVASATPRLYSPHNAALSPAVSDAAATTVMGATAPRPFRPHAPRGRPPKKFSLHTYRSQLLDSENPLKLTIRVERSAAVCSAASVRGARGRRRHRRRSRHADSDDDDMGMNGGAFAESDGTRIRRGGAAGRRGRRVARTAAYSRLSASPPQFGSSTSAAADAAAAGASSSVSAYATSAADTMSGWGDETRMPRALLHRILGHVVADDGAVPVLVHLSRVCRLWHAVATDTGANTTSGGGGGGLWRCVDLNCPLVPEYRRHVRTLLWLCENRLTHTEELSLAGWGGAVGAASVSLLCSSCCHLQSLSLSGCRALTCHMLLELAQRLPQLQQLELSDVQPTLSGGAHCPLSQPSLQLVAETMGARLRALNISHNCVSGIPAIVDLLATHCPLLELLDLSNMHSMVRDVVAVNIERLQHGCRHMRVLRWTNTQLKLADTSIKEQICSAGFPELEELSVAVPRGASWAVDDGQLQRLLKSAGRLLLLDVRGCERVSDSCLVRVPAAALQHLYLSGTQAGRLGGGGCGGGASRLELLVAKWRHSLLELDLSWASDQQAVDGAIGALCGDSSGPAGGGGEVRQLRRLQLAGSAVTFEPLARLVLAAPQLRHLDLTSCRSLPRGIKRSHVGAEQLAVLRQQIREGRFSQL